MKKTIIIILLIFGLVVFGCLGTPNSGQNNAGGNTQTTSNSGATSSAGGVGTIVGGTGSVGNPTQMFTSCNSDCAIAGEGPAVSCRVGCIMDYARAERSVARCSDIYSVPRVDEYQLADTYYNGCIDQVAVARNSIEPCSMMRGNSGLEARRNACIINAAQETGNYALCEGLQMEQHAPELDDAYRQTFAEMQANCRGTTTYPERTYPE